MRARSILRTTDGGRKARATRTVHWQKVFVDDDAAPEDEHNEARPADNFFSHRRVRALRIAILTFEAIMIPLRCGLPAAFLDVPLFIALDVLVDTAELAILAIRLWPPGGHKDEVYAPLAPLPFAFAESPA